MRPVYTMMDFSKKVKKKRRRKKMCVSALSCKFHHCGIKGLLVVVLIQISVFIRVACLRKGSLKYESVKTHRVIVATVKIPWCKSCSIFSCLYIYRQLPGPSPGKSFFFLFKTNLVLSAAPGLGLCRSPLTRPTGPSQVCMVPSQS